MTAIASVLVAYATKHESTHEVAETVAAELAARGLRVETRPAAEIFALEGYDAVVLGTALYMGRPHRDARHFLERHRGALAALPVAIFAMGPKSLSEEDVAGARGQLDQALGKVPDVRPVATAIFGGVVDPAKLRFPFSRMPATDARDWDAIRAWAGALAGELQASAAASA